MLLYTYPENFRAYKALIAAQFSGANVQVAPNFEFGKTNQTPEFLKKFPLGKVSIIKKHFMAFHFKNVKIFTKFAKL